MDISRRASLRSLVLGPLVLSAAPSRSGQSADQASPTDHDSPFNKSPADEPRLPNGKSQRDEIARQQHTDALKDVETLLTTAGELRDELKHAGSFVVPVTSVRKTEEIEKLAKRIRGRLKN